MVLVKSDIIGKYFTYNKLWPGRDAEG